MRLVRGFPAIAFATVLLSIVGFHVAERAVGLLLVAGVLAALSWYVTEGPRGRYLPGWTSNVLIIAIWLYVIVDFLQKRDDVIGALGQLLVWLTLVKLYQRKTPRDYAQLLTLSLMLVLLGCVQSHDLLFAAVVLAYGVLGLHALLLYQLYASYERTRTQRLAETPDGHRVQPSLQPVFGRRSGWQFRWLMSGVGLSSLAASAVFFVVFPRHPDGGAGRERRAGFSDEVDLAASTRITSSRRVVLTLRMPGAPRAEPWRLRGAVLDQYRGHGRWSSSAAFADWRYVRATRRRPAALGVGKRPDALTVTQQVEVFAPGRTLFSIDAPVSVATPASRDIRFDPVTAVLRDAGATHTRPLRRYTIEAQPGAGDETFAYLLGGRSVEPSPRAGRNVDPDVVALARRVLMERGVERPGDDAPPKTRHAFAAAAAAALSDYLRTGMFRYELDLRDVVVGPGVDPIHQFLFQTRRGHCEYFASALAAMCLGLEIPARLVTGYVAMEFDPGAGHYVVRESNAHAWVEVRTGPHRWRTFDPTPPATLLELHGEQGVGDRARWVFDRFEAWWRNDFLGFDRRAQEQVLSRLGSGWSRELSDAARATLAWAARLNRAFYFGPAGYIWMGIVALAVGIAIVAAARFLRRQRRLKATLHLHARPAREQRRMARQLGFYLDMLELLERAGRAKPAWQPPLAYARALRRTDARAAKVVREITSLFYAARYGGRELSREQIARADERLERLGEALGRS